MSLILVLFCCAVVNDVAWSGKVVDEQGRPIADAMVVVGTCKPRAGLGTTCPSCYPECSKHGRTDQQGRFSITSISSNLLVTVAIGGKGYHGTIVENVDPHVQETLPIVLKALPKEMRARSIRGQVVNSDGQPLAGVLVRPQYIDSVNRSSIPGANTHTTSLVLTDEAGWFEVAIAESVAGLYLRTSIGGWAASQVQWTAPTEKDVLVRLERGSAISGRLEYQGKPVVGAQLEVVTAKRDVFSLLEVQQVATDANGYFKFEHLQPECDYALYTLLDQNIPAVLPVCLVKTAGTGKVTDYDMIELEPAQPVSITIATDDGSPLPQAGKIYVSRYEAWRGADLPLPAHGRSTATVVLPSVGEEELSLSIRLPNYTVVRTDPVLAADLNSYYTFDTHKLRALKLILKRQ